MSGRGCGLAALAVVVVLALLVALSVAACGPAPQTDPATRSPASASPSTSPSASAAPSSDATSPSSSGGSVVVDPTLLDVLPADIDGQPLRPDAETAGEIARSENLTNVEAIAIGLYIRPGSSTADDLAIASVVRLRPGVFDDGWFRSWRTTYDDGACQVAGGVEPGGSQVQIGGHDTDIGACKGGVHTYHVHLTDPDRVVSITAAGEGRFGERVVAGLTE